MDLLIISLIKTQQGRSLVEEVKGSHENVKNVKIGIFEGHLVHFEGHFVLQCHNAQCIVDSVTAMRLQQYAAHAVYVRIREYANTDAHADAIADTDANADADFLVDSSTSIFLPRDDDAR